MNSVNSKIAKIFTKRGVRPAGLLAVAAFAFVSALTVRVPEALAWEVDFSRRQVDFKRVNNENRLPASVKSSEPAGLLDRVFESTEPAQDIVIMNTEKGFVPESIHLRKGATYRLHVVNVNSKEKNVSFILDAFSEHHNTVYGQVKSFTVSPKADGVFAFQCPETSVQGRVVVIPNERKPASK